MSLKLPQKTIDGYRLDAARMFMTALVTANQTMSALNEDEPYSPRRSASIACDLANALYDEFERREWITVVPEVAPPLPTLSVG